MNQTIEEQNIQDQYICLLDQAEISKENEELQKDFEENFQNFISKFELEDSRRIITYFRSQFPQNRFLETQILQYQQIQSPQQVFRCIKTLAKTVVSTIFNTQRSKFDVIQAYVDAQQRGDFRLIYNLSQDDQFFHYMDFPIKMKQFRDVIGRLEEDGLKIWEIAELCQNPAFSINFNLFRNILFFVFNKLHLAHEEQMRILQCIAEITSDLIIQFKYLVNQQQFLDEEYFQRFMQIFNSIINQRQEISLLDEFTKKSYIFNIIKKIAQMNFDDFLDYWFTEIAEMFQVDPGDQEKVELLVNNTFIVDFDTKCEYLYYLTLFSLWYSFDFNFSIHSSHQQINTITNRTSIDALIPINNNKELIERKSTEKSRSLLLTKVFSLSDKEQELFLKQKEHVSEFKISMPSSPSKLFQSSLQFWKPLQKFKKISNSHFQEIFARQSQDQQQVKRILIAAQQISQRNLQKGFQFLQQVFKDAKKDIPYYFGLISQQNEYKTKDKQVLLQIIFLFHNYDLELYPIYFQQLIQANNIGFPQGMRISLEDFNLSLTFDDDKEKSRLINHWVKNMWDPITLKNLIPLFFNVFKREERIQELLFEINDSIIENQISYCDQINQKMLFQIFYNNSNEELKVMLLKLQSRYSPIPLLYRKAQTKQDCKEDLILNVNVFYVFLESYTIINFCLSQNNSRIGKTELINKIFYQFDKFETRDACAINNNTIDIMFDYSFCETRKLAVADCHHLIPLKKLDKLLPLFKLWIVQVDGEKEIDEALEQLQQLSSFKNGQYQKIIFLIRNSSKSENFKNQFEKLDKLKIDHEKIKDLTSNRLSKQNIESEITKVGKKLYTFIGQNHEKNYVNQKDFIQIIEKFTDFKYNFEFQQNLKILNALETELNKLVMQEDAFINQNAFPVRYLENKITQCKEKYQKMSIVNQKEKAQLQEEIKDYEKKLTAQTTTTILDLFCQIFSQQNYYILYLWFVDIIRSFNKHHTDKLFEENKQINNDIDKDKQLLKQLKQEKSNSNFQQIKQLDQSIKDKKKKYSTNEEDLLKRYISIELFWREIIYQSKHKPLPYNMNPAQIVHDMISKGEPFEFLNGDQLKIDQTFLEELIKQFKNQGKEQILVLSVLGPQSSGKSTILNKIFGCHFWTSTGRCTKGIYLQLLKIQNKKQFNDQFDYILILDTEGLQSTNQTDQEFDKKIALFVISISDIILITVKGEITAQFSNLIQMCIFSLRQLTSVSSLKQISWCFNQNHDADNYNPFLESLNGIAKNLNFEIQQQSEETQDYYEILGIKIDNMQVLGFAQTEQKWKKDIKSGYYGDWRQYNLQEAFSQEAYDFGKKIINAYSIKFQSQTTKEMMKDLNSFIINLCKQWLSITQLPDLLEFSELIQHQQNQIMKVEFERIVQNQNIQSSQDILNDIRAKILKQGKQLKIAFYKELQEDKEAEATKMVEQSEIDMINQLEKFKNENKIQKKIFKKFEIMIKNRIKSQIQECQLAMRNEIQNHMIDFQRQNGFYKLEQFVKMVKEKQEQLLRLKNDHNLIKEEFDEIWKQITDQQTENINDIFQEFALQLFKIITKEFQHYCLRSQHEIDFQTFFIKELVKEKPKQQDFEKIFNKFSVELQVNQFVPIELNFKNRLFNELFHRDFDLKIKSQTNSNDILKLVHFFKGHIQVFYVNQDELREYLKLHFLKDLQQFINQPRYNSNKNHQLIAKIVNEFFSLLCCFGVRYDQSKVYDFIRTLENKSSFFSFLKSEEQRERELISSFENMYIMSTEPNQNLLSEQEFNRIKQLYVNLRIHQQEFYQDVKPQEFLLQFARDQLGSTALIIHLVQEIEYPIQDQIYKDIFQYISNWSKFSHYQNTFKSYISEIIQKEMRNNLNQKWKELYLKIYEMITKEIQIENPQQPVSSQDISLTQIEFSIPEYNAARIRLLMSRIELCIDDQNKSFSNFGIILNDIGQRCIYYFSLLVVWRFLCYGQWEIKSLHLRKLHDQTENEFKKFKADILENELEQSVLRGNALAIEVYNNIQKSFYHQNSYQAQNDLSKYQNITCMSIIKQLDQQILEKGDPNVPDQQIMDYIKNQYSFIEKVVNENITKYSQEIQAKFQQNFQQTTKKVLLDLKKNLKNLKEFSIDSMKAKDYFESPSLQHEKILFQIVIQCLQGNTEIQELKMIKEEYRDAFSLINPTKINLPLIDSQKSTSDYEIYILKNFIAAFTDKIEETTSNCHKLQIDLRELKVQNILDEIKLVQLGCLHSCPICKRKCDYDQKVLNHKHQCQNGHQLRGMNRVLINNSPSLYICEEINDDSLLQIQETGVVKRWKDIKGIYNQWQFSCFDIDELKCRKDKMTNIWNNKIGKMVCKQLEKDMKIQINFIQKLENQQHQFSSPLQNIHYILIVDGSGSMQGERWQNVVNGVKEFMFVIQNNYLAKITIIIFDHQPFCVVDFESLNIEQQIMKLQFRGGGTNFDNALMLAFEKLANNSAFQQYQKHQMYFYTDGEAQCPNLAIDKFKQMAQDQRQKIELIACTESNQSVALEQLVQKIKTVISAAELKKSVSPPQMGQVWVETLTQRYHKLQI